MKLQRETAGHGMPIEAQFGYSGAVRVGNTVHIAGQLPRDAAGKQVPGSLTTKVSVAYDNISVLVAKFGLTLDNVVQVQIHVDAPLLANMDVIQAVSRQRLRLPDVSLTVLQISGLNDVDGMVEISAVACSAGKREGNIMGKDISSKSYSLVNSSAARLGASDVVEHENILYVSGQLPVDAAGRILFPGDIVGQFGAALDRVDLALRGMNSSISRVLALDIFTAAALTPERFDDFCSAHRERMTEYRPTGTMVRVAQLPLEGALVYISAIAAR